MLTNFIKDKLMDIRFEGVSNSDDLDHTYSSFTKCLTYYLDRFFPIKHITLTSRDPPFVTPNIKAMLRLRNRLMHKGRIEEASVITKKINHSISTFNISRFKTNNIREYPKNVWKKVNAFLGRGKSIDDSSIGDPTLTVKDFNNYYVNLSTSTEPLNVNTNKKSSVHNCVSDSCLVFPCSGSVLFT